MAFIAKGELEYGFKKKLLELFDKDISAYRTLQEAIRSSKLPLTRDELEKMDDWGVREQTVTAEDIDAWNAAGINVTVSRIAGLRSNSRSLHETIYQISVANIGLLSIQRVDYLEDCCTNELQGYLDRGWRILAVCPPNDTRRPTYIVGHMEKEAR